MKDMISNNSINEYGKENNIENFNTSAETREGVEEAFNYFINKNS